MSMCQEKPSAGFSLVELSIVLVILGLLVGGILGGQSLIHAAELRSVGEEYKSWQTAVNSFRDKYFSLPGDMKNATAFWGAVNTGGTNGNCSDPVMDEGTGTQTCNGDGNGTINQFNEYHRFWQHLANAGLISGTYTGVPGPASGEHAVIGENCPKSKFANTGWSVYDRDNDPGNAYFFANNYGHVYYLGAQHFVSGTIDPGLSPVDAWNIDTKFDDGKPGEGIIISHWWGTCTDAASETDTANAEYALDKEDTIACSLIFKNAF